MNVVVLRGHLSSEPQCRPLASGSVLYSLEVTTSTPDGAWSVPVAWFDPPTEPTFAAGTEVVVVGAVRRRFFRGGAGTQSRTEVVAVEVVAASARKRAERAVQRAAASLGPDVGQAVPSQ
jgi:single-stranded DNA-binding protein